MGDPIKKVVLRDGTVRYRFVTDGPRKADGKRRQVTKTYDTKTEARSELARIRHQSKTGEYVAPTKLTVNELLDIWLKAATRDVEEATSSNYDNAVRPVRNHLGYKRVQQLTEEDVEEFVDWLVTSGRRMRREAGHRFGCPLSSADARPFPLGVAFGRSPRLGGPKRRRARSNIPGGSHSRSPERA